MATNQYQETWFNTAPGRATDPDGVGGFQCVDAAKDYFEHIFGVSWHKGWPGAGNAKDMLGTADPEYFDVIPNSSDPNLIPVRGDIIVYAGTTAAGVNPYGHIAVVIDADTKGVTVIQQDGFLQCPMFVGHLGYDNPGTGPVLGWLRPKFDDTPTAAGAPIAGAVQRTVVDRGVNERDAASTNGKVTETYTGGSVLNMKGFVHGDAIDGNDVWFVGAVHGKFYHASGFTDPTTTGMTNLTPPQKPAVQGFQRITGSNGAVRRTAPDKNATVLDNFMPDRVLDLGGFVHGTDPYGAGNDVWFVGKYSGGYMWSGAFTDSSTNGLTDVTPAKDSAAPIPTVKPYDFALDFASVTREDGVTVSVVKTPANTSNVDTGNFPAQPEKVVIHQFGTVGVDTFQSTEAQFAKAGTFVSAHFSVSGRNIHQHVSLHDRAYHAASVGNAWVGIETDPAQDPETIATVRALLLALADHYKRKLTTIKHRDVPGCSTACGAVIDLAKYDVTWPKATPAPAPAPAPIVEQTPAASMPVVTAGPPPSTAPATVSIPIPVTGSAPTLALDELGDFVNFLVKLYRESKVNA